MAGVLAVPMGPMGEGLALEGALQHQLSHLPFGAGGSTGQ